MKIMHVVQRTFPAKIGGSERYMWHISRKLAGAGDDVTVLTSDVYENRGAGNPLSSKIPDKEEVVDGIKIVRKRSSFLVNSAADRMAGLFTKLGFKAAADICGYVAAGPFMPGVFSYLKSNECDLIHASPVPLSHVWFAYKAARKKNIPFIVTPFFHVLMEGYYNGTVRDVLAGSDAVIACTETEKKKLSEFGVKEEKIYVSPMGIEINEWEGQSGGRFRAEYGLEDECIVLVPAKDVYKGSLHVLGAVRMLQKEMKNMVVVMIGTGDDKWEKQMKEFSDVRIIDVGWIDGLAKRDLFDAADIIAMPSVADAFGIVYLEAWMCGKPVIGAKTDIMSDVIKDGSDGYLVKFGDINAIMEKLRNLCRNAEVRKKMGSAGKEKVEARYNWDKVSVNMRNIYSKVLKGQ